VIHPVLNETDIWSRLLQYVYVVGGSYAALPSAHIYMTTLLSLFFSAWYLRQRLLWLLIYWVVVFSTLFTGQHYILDIVAGTALAWLGYRFGLWYAGPAQPFKILMRKIGLSSK
jgi:membrane-associated phospholipid phosphatase